MRLICETLSELSQVATKIRAFALQHQLVVWVLEGEMGAGKTTLIKELGKTFGIMDMISSPTFSIINEYVNQQGQLFYHFDFYRLGSQHEALDIGCQEYLDSGNYCFLEWATRIPDLLPASYLFISIQVEDDQTRIFNLIVK